jgi:heme-degrading monooxygenase HmoA
MIVREWRGRAASSRAAEYPRHFRAVVVPELKHVAGFRGASLCRRDSADGIEFVVLTRWESLDAVRAFAGAQIDRAVVEPGAVAALDSFDTSVKHYEIIEEVSGT